MSLRILSLAEQYAAVVSGLVSVREMPAAQRKARTAIADALPPGTLATSSRLTIWRELGDRIDYAPGVIVEKDFVAREPLTFMTIPAGRAAQWTLNGGFEGLPGAWTDLFVACKAEGLVLANLNWEIYGRDGAPAAQLFTRLA